MNLPSQYNSNHRPRGTLETFCQQFLKSSAWEQRYSRIKKCRKELLGVGRICAHLSLRYIDHNPLALCTYRAPGGRHILCHHRVGLPSLSYLPSPGPCMTHSSQHLSRMVTQLLSAIGMAKTTCSHSLCDR